MDKRRNVVILLGLALIMLVLLTASKYFYKTLHFGEYKSPHKEVYTCHDYFAEMLEESRTTRADYVMYMRSAFISMLGDKEVIIDERLSDEDKIQYSLDPIKCSQKDIGILNEDFEKNGIANQRYCLVDKEGHEHKVFIMTGQEWETSSCIKIFYDIQKNLIIVPTEAMDNMELLDMDMPIESFEYETVYMQMEMDETVHRIAGKAHKNQIIIHQILFILFLVSIGLIISKNIFDEIGFMSIWLIIPIAVINQIIAVFFLVVFHIKITLLSYILASYLAAIGLRVFLWRRGKHDKNTPSRKFDKRSIFSITLWTALILWFCFKPYVILSHDSIINIYIGKYAVITGGLNTMLARVASFSLLTPFLEVGNALFGIDLNYSLQPILTITSMVVIAWIWYKILGDYICSVLKATFIIWSMITLMMNPLFYIQTFWKLNNLAIGLFTGIMIGMHLLYYQTNKKIYFSLGNVFLIIIANVRLESGLFAAVYFICLYTLFLSKNKGKEVETLSFGITIISTSIFFYYFCIIGNVESVYWTPMKGLAVNILLWLVYIYFRGSFIIKKKFFVIYNNIDRVMTICILFCVLGFGLMERNVFINNLKCFVQNMGNYGAYWALALLSILLSISVFRKDEIIRFLSLYLASYFLLIPGLMIFREVPLRIGFGDSACRMLSHIIVVVGFLCLYILNLLLRREVITEV